jgi:hypothetical protein
MAPVAAPNLGLLSAYAYRYRQTLDPTQTGVWLATQLQLHERLQLTLGGRWDRYRHAGLVADNFRMPMQRTDQDRLQHFSRYAGLVWELDARHSAYLQTSDIFQPRTERDMAGQVLPSTTGRTYGAGLQGRYLDQRLQAGIHLFQATQRHALEQEYQQFTCPSYPGVACYRSIEQVRSRGVTLQLQGQITPGWQLSASTTLVSSRHTQDPQKQGQRYEPQLPRLQWQLSTVYRLPDSAWRRQPLPPKQHRKYRAGHPERPVPHPPALLHPGGADGGTPDHATLAATAERAQSAGQALLPQHRSAHVHRLWTAAQLAGHAALPVLSARRRPAITYVSGLATPAPAAIVRATRTARTP